jgi:hypothetical protein
MRARIKFKCDGTIKDKTNWCNFATYNDALEIHCQVANLIGPRANSFVYHIDRSVDLPRPSYCPFKSTIACDDWRDKPNARTDST